MFPNYKIINIKQQPNKTTLQFLVDIMNSHADPRALRRAQNAETQRMQRANRGSLEEEYNHHRARRAIPGVREH